MNEIGLEFIDVMQNKFYSLGINEYEIYASSHGSIKRNKKENKNERKTNRLLQNR